ncbi:5113_t:CDS:1, partial [Dentiscutata heterogama]
GVGPNEAKTEKVKKFPISENLCQLKGFIGLASYYHCFIKGFTMIARPLYKLLEKDVQYKWEEDQ